MAAAGRGIGASGAMEKMSGMLEQMRLTDKEKRGLRIGKTQVMQSAPKDPQAVGKVLSEKPVRPESIAASLGKVWCPIRGVDCKDLGDNHFLFTFLQASGKRRALEDGP